MKNRKQIDLRRAAGALIAAILMFAAIGCSISDQKENGAEKVAINTPMGALKVRTNINPEDVGLKIYPGATLKPSDTSDHDKSANVNISTPLFGLKVVALDYVSNDSPKKILDFYRKDMTQYGKVIECQGTSATSGTHTENQGFKLELNCDDTGKGDATDLKAGEGSAQHIVSVTPKGSGSEFGLVYIQLHGKSDETM